MPRNQKVIVIALLCSILVLITWTVVFKRQDIEQKPPRAYVTSGIIPESVNARGGLTKRQYALEHFGPKWFRPCTLYWSPSPEPNNTQVLTSFGTPQAYLVYVDGIRRIRLEKDVFQWTINVEGEVAAVSAANSKGESQRISMRIPIDCLPLPKLP